MTVKYKLSFSMEMNTDANAHQRIREDAQAGMIYLEGYTGDRACEIPRRTQAICGL